MGKVKLSIDRGDAFLGRELEDPRQAMERALAEVREERRERELRLRRGYEVPLS